MDGCSFGGSTTVSILVVVVVLVGLEDPEMGRSILSETATRTSRGEGVRWVCSCLGWVWVSENDDDEESRKLEGGGEPAVGVGISEPEAEE